MSLRNHRKSRQIKFPINFNRKCSNCEGTGKVVSVNFNVFGEYESVGVCWTCKGTGKIKKNNYSWN